MFVCYNCFIFAEYFKTVIMILLSLGTFLAYVTIAIIIVIMCFYGASKEPLTMYGIPAERVKKAKDRLDDWGGKIDSIEKTLKQIEKTLKQIENKNKEDFEESEKESQSPE